MLWKLSRAPPPSSIKSHSLNISSFLSHSRYSLTRAVLILLSLIWELSRLVELSVCWIRCIHQNYKRSSLRLPTPDFWSRFSGLLRRLYHTQKQFPIISPLSLKSRNFSLIIMVYFLVVDVDGHDCLQAQMPRKLTFPAVLVGPDSNPTLSFTSGCEGKPKLELVH